MVNIDTEEGLEEWLRVRPDNFAVVLSVRAALRAIPSLAFQIDKKSNTISDSSSERTLAVFRAVHSAWTISQVGPSGYDNAASAAALDCEDIAKRMGEQTRQLIFSFSNAAHAASGNNPPYTAALSIYDAIYSLAYAVQATTASLGRPQTIERVVRHANEAFHLEINSLDLGGSIESLSDSPLWPDKRLTWVNTSWDKLKTALLARDEDWSVWIEWYESRINGRATLDFTGARSLSIDKEIASQGSNFWNRAPRVVNSDIYVSINKALISVFEQSDKTSIADFIVKYLEKLSGSASVAEILKAFQISDRRVLPHTVRAQLSRLTASGQIQRVAYGVYASINYSTKSDSTLEISSVEPQTLGAIQFAGREDHPIEVKHKASAGELSVSDSDIKRHQEVVRRTDQLIQSYSREQQGGNASKVILEEIILFRESLGETIEFLDPDLLIPRGDALRNDLVAHQSKDDFSRLAPVPDDLLLALQKMLASYNHYVSFDVELARRDEALLGPDARRKLVPPSEGQRVIKDAVALNAAMPEVESILGVEAKIAPEVPDQENRQSRRYSEGAKNFARKAIERASDYAKVAWHHKGKIFVASGSGFTAAQWVLTHQEWLLEYFSENALMLDIIRKLISVLKQLPL